MTAPETLVTPPLAPAPSVLRSVAAPTTATGDLSTLLGITPERPVDGQLLSRIHRESFDPAISSAVTHKASSLLAGIGAIQESRLNAFVADEKYGDRDEFARLPNGEFLSQREFAARYLIALTEVVGVAQQLLSQGLTLEDLRQRRSALTSSHEGQIELPKFDSEQRSALQSSYEQGIRAKIVGLSYGAESAELELRGIDLACIALTLATREVKLAQLLHSDECQQKLSEYKLLMNTARAMAGNRGGIEVANAFCDLVQQRHGYYPSLKYYSDFDGKLTHVPESGSHWKPGEHTNALLNHLDEICGIPLFPRLVLTEHPGLDVRLRALAQGLYGIAADESVFFSDVVELFNRLQRAGPGVEHAILTANHTGLVATKLQRAGLHCNRIIGVDAQHHYPNKVEVLLTEILSGSRFALHLMGDDNDGPLAAHIAHGCGSDVAAKYGVPAYLGELMIFAARGHDATRQYRMVAALEGQGLPFFRNSLAPDGHGLHESIEFLHAHLHHREPNGRNHIVRYPVSYQPGDVIRLCREALKLDTLMPKPVHRTVIKPIREVAQDNWQFDLGVPSAVFDPRKKSWIVFYKSANGPSGPEDKVGFRVTSNVFAAGYDSKTGSVQFLNPDGEVVSQRQLKPYLESSLPPHVSIDGLHDPRVTYIPSLDAHLLLGCAFNKKEEQQSMREAAGDLSKPIRGAVTELVRFRNGLDRSTFTSLGQFGPDFHFKNMVFFPQTISVNGVESLLVMTRKMPGIQIFPVAVSQIEELCSNPAKRNAFWQKLLSPDSIARHTVMNPVLPHEGFKNPNAPGRKGQLAPGLPPIHVRVPNSSGGESSYWLVIYNSVPDFMPNVMGSSRGRVISAALLDYDDPWHLVARSPLPIIVPRSDSEMAHEGYLSRHEDVAFTGGGGVDDAGKLVIFYTEGDSIIRSATYGSVDSLTQYLLRFDYDGREKSDSYETLHLVGA